MQQAATYLQIGDGLAAALESVPPTPDFEVVLGGKGWYQQLPINTKLHKAGCYFAALRLGFPERTALWAVLRFTRISRAGRDRDVCRKR